MSEWALQMNRSQLTADNFLQEIRKILQVSNMSDMRKHILAAQPARKELPPTEPCLQEYPNGCLYMQVTSLCGQDTYLYSLDRL